MTCLDDNLVLAYVEHAASAEERIAVERHIAQCASCRRLLADARRVLSSTGAPPIDPDSAVPDAREPEALTVPTASDPLVRALIHSRIASQLFEQFAVPVTIGRFHVLERIGRGGMGRVYAAYDPDLDRRIAVKVVPAGDHSARERLLGEAQALARLSHPNVVPVYDVEVVADEVCIVMEFVRGPTLRVWRTAEPRSWRDVLHVYRQVGEGLQAAHRAGLVHRDIKPDNAILGHDGRVRVVDFGLARPMVAEDGGAAAATTGEPRAAATHPAGTPRYMAPEQAAGLAVTAAADQYAFCATLREALDGSAPWLSPVLDRGTARDPAQRFASMSELLRALARDPAATRRRWVVAGVIALVLAGSGALGGAVLTGREPQVAVEPCSGGAGEIAAVWNDTRQAALAAHLAATGAYGSALAPQLLGALDGYATRWAATHRAVCLAHRRGEQTGEMHDQQMACLQWIKRGLSTVIDVVSRSDGSTLPGTALAVAALPGLAVCDPAALLGMPRPPAQIAGDIARLDGELERAIVLVEAGRADEARDIATRVVAEARQHAFAPLLARSLLALGRAEMALEPRVRAIAPLREATAVALRAGSDAVAVEAYARRAWVEGTDDRTADGNVLDGVTVIEALAERIPQSGFVRALLHNNVGAVEGAAGHHDREVAALQRALRASRDVPEPVPVEIIAIRGNLASYEPDPVRCQALFAATTAELAARVGDQHPMTLDARFRAALAVDDDAAAVAALEPVCTTYQHLHPAYGVAIASCWFELGWLAYHRGDIDRATRALTAAAGTPDIEPEREMLHRGYLALVQHDRQAVPIFDRLLAALRGEGPWWSRLMAGEAYLGRGLAHGALGDRKRAAADLAAAETLLASVAQEQPHAYIVRRLMRVRVERRRL